MSLHNNFVQLGLGRGDRPINVRSVYKSFDKLTHLQLWQCLVIDDHECVFLAAEDVDVPGVNVEPEGVDVDPAALVRPHEVVARDVLHLQQGVDHGQLVRHAELLVHVDVCRELGVLVEFVEQQRPPELGSLQAEEFSDGSVAVRGHPGAQRGERLQTANTLETTV